VNSKYVKWDSRNFLMVILFLQFTACATVFFDIPVARQVIGFICFTFVPGFIVIKLLKLDELDRVETVLFSVGLSVAFLMLVGLFVNELSFLFGISQPLSLIPLMIVLNGFMLLGGILIYLRSENVKLWNIPSLRISLFVLPLASLPIFSIVGATWVKTYGNNLILLFMIIAIALLFAVGVISRKSSSSDLYPLAVFVIAISLLYHSSLISEHLVHFGSDVPGEMFAFKIVEKNAYWSSINPYPDDFSVGRTYSMLSVTILPSIYSSLLNLNSIWVFKLLNPTLYALVPLGLYVLWSKSVGNKYAFVSAFFFMAYRNFSNQMLGLSKQMIAELFLVLVLIAMFHKKMNRANKKICFLVFSIALAVSHYALAEIFLIFISFALIPLIIIKKPGRNITFTMVLYFFGVMFGWYLFTSSSSVLDSFLNFGQNVYNQLGEFLNLQSRGSQVLRGLGLETPPTIWNRISRAFAYLTEIFISIGFIGLIMKRKRIRFEKEYLMLIIAAMGFLAALVLVPGLAETMNMSRFYHILLFFIAPLCVIGAELIIELMFKRKDELKITVLLLIVLVPYFLFQTGFVYEVTSSESWSLPLSKYRMSGIRLYTEFGLYDEYSISGAQWLSKNVAVGTTQMYADSFSRTNELRSYGFVWPGYVEILSNITEVKPNGVVYLNSLNIIEGKVVGTGLLWNSSEFHFLHDLNKIYSNGGSGIYKNTT